MTEQYELTELDSLKQIADNMGIAYKHNIGIETLREKISAQRKVVENQNKPKATNHTQNMAREAQKLHRVIVTPMDPLLRESDGDFFTVHNSMIGTVSKFIAYNVEYHVPAALLGILEEATYRHSYEVMDHATGRKVHKSRDLPKYSITRLPALSVEELQAIADEQIKRGLGDD